MDIIFYTLEGLSDQLGAHRGKQGGRSWQGHGGSFGDLVDQSGFTAVGCTPFFSDSSWFHLSPSFDHGYETRDVLWIPF